MSPPAHLLDPTRTRLGRAVLQLVLPAALIALWWWTSRDSGSYLNPPLSEVTASLRDDWLDRLSSDLAPSLRRFGLGYLLAAVLGVAGGTAIGLSDRLRRATAPLTEFVRSIPSPLLFPFALVVFGIGDDSKVGLIALGSLWPVLLNTADGVRGVDPQVIDVARAFGLDRRMRIGRVILPAASPKIVAGLRIALSVALLLMVVSEMQGGTNGLGFQIRAAQRSFDTAETYAGVVVIGVVGLLVNTVFVAIERRLMHWHRGDRGLLEEDVTTGSGGPQATTADTRELTHG
jgi:ABC-type nitrate/sulfonate/bicarbonate transport system permease component